MKLKYLTLVATAAIFAACDDNEQPGFSDSDAFVAFNSATVTVDELGSKGEPAQAVSVSVTLASVAGLTTEASIEVVDKNSDESLTAVEGENFEIVGSKTLSFNAENRTASISVRYIPDGVFTGDLSFKLVLKSDKVGVGHESECLVTLSDAEHPLQAILGTYAASADSYFSNRGHFDWNITISKDAEDLAKVWIDGLDPYFAANGYLGHIYGTVNEDKTEIAVPVGQSYGYQNTEIVAFSTADPDDANSIELKQGDNIIIAIEEGGAKLVVKNSFGIYDDGWWNLMKGDLVFTKK